MNRLLFVLLLSAVSLSGFSYEEPIAPADPEIKELQVPDVQLITPTNDLMILIRSQAVYSDGRILDGNIRLTNHLVLTVTNNRLGTVEVKAISIYDISRIEIVRWKPLKQSSDTYLFLPDTYKIESGGSVYLYPANIPELNAFEWNDDSGRKRFFTLFYDNWIAGKKGAFRWENSKSTAFSYNSDHPIDGVVKELKIYGGY